MTKFAQISRKPNAVALMSGPLVACFIMQPCEGNVLEFTWPNCNYK